MYHYGLIQQGPGGILVSEKRGTAGGCASDIETHREPCQCPDCGKLNCIRTATVEEGRAFQARKLEDVWRDVAPVLAG